MLHWQPSTNHTQLRLRAEVLAEIRAFFAEKSVLEVETPLIGRATGTDPQLDFFSTRSHCLSEADTFYLQTSPEFAMKRLLAAGSGDIYQICKAFRNGEAGRLHNPEFTLVEWYRIGFDLNQLMDEVADLLMRLFALRNPLSSVEIISYQNVFEQYTGLDALTFQPEEYRACAERLGLSDALRLCGEQHSVWLDFLFSHQVQPGLGQRGLTLVHGYPACQAALARISPTDLRTAERMEAFIRGIEIGNGYFELTDAVEQNLRFEAELAFRAQQNLAPVTKDLKFLAALQAGLPECAGIAIGLDRLLMLLGETGSIDEVLAFSIARV